MLLCDAAQVADGKLFILGGGWSLIGPDPMPTAIAVKVDVEWNETGRPHHWELFLVDEDGRPVIVDGPDGPQPIEVRGDFEVGRPDGVPEGSPVDVALAINFTWHFTVDGEAENDWQVAFFTRPERAAPEE
jgi:hypothetical protein